jgi:hypothetical protein
MTARNVHSAIAERSFGQNRPYGQSPP